VFIRNLTPLSDIRAVRRNTDGRYIGHGADLSDFSISSFDLNPFLTACHDTMFAEHSLESFIRCDA
jgi:hypothetical protein